MPTPCPLRNPYVEPHGPPTTQCPAASLRPSPYPQFQGTLTPSTPNSKGLLIQMLETLVQSLDQPQKPRFPAVRPRTSEGGDSIRGTGVWCAPWRQRWRLSWQCKNCTEALKTRRRRKLKWAAQGRGGGKVTDESAGQPSRSSARAGPGARREDGVTQQLCRARPQPREGRARAAWMGLGGVRGAAVRIGCPHRHAPDPSTPQSTPAQTHGCLLGPRVAPRGAGRYPLHLTALV